MELVLFSLDLGKLRESVLKRRTELGVLSFELGEFLGERDVLLLQKRASLLGGDGGGVGLGFDGLELVVEVPNEGIRLLGDQSDVVRAPRVLLVGNEKRHIL